MFRFHGLVSLLWFAFLLPAASAESLFVEEFDDNRANWPMLGEGDTQITSFEKGRLIFENLSPEPKAIKWSFLPVDIPPAANIEISLTLEYLDGPKDVSFGLVWELDPKTTPFRRRHFDVSNNGGYIIWSRNEQDFNTERTWQTSSHVRQSGPNTLVIQRYGRRVFYLLNGTPIEAFDQSTYGNSVGFTLSSGLTVAVDRLAVSKLEGDAPAVAKRVKELEAAVLAHRIASGPPLEDIIETFDDNQRNWPFLKGGATWTAAIADGAMTWENRATSSQTTGIKLPVNGYVNYELALKLRHVAGPVDRGVGFSWGASDVHTAGGFFIAANGGYLVTQRNGKDLKTVIPWTRTSVIKQDGENELRVRKLQNTFFLFVNGVLLADLPARDPLGDNLKLEIPQGETVAFNELRLTYLKIPDDRVAKEVEQHVKNLEKEHGKNGQRSSLVLAKINEENRLRAEGVIRDEPSEADEKYFRQVRKKYVTKSALSVIADRGKPFETRGEAVGPRLYYKYKVIGRTQFYYEFRLMHVGPDTDVHGKLLPIKPENLAVTDVELTSKPW